MQLTVILIFHFPGEHLSEKYKQNVNRFGKVPCIIDHTGFKLAESNAIFGYLSRERYIEDHWYPNESKHRAKIDEYLSWSHNNVRASIGMLFQTSWVQPLLTKVKADPKKVESYKKLTNQSLDILENIWLNSDHKYLVGNKMSIADIFGSADIQQLKICGINPCEGRPKLEAWYKNVRENLNPHFDFAHKFIDKNSELYKGVPPIQE